MHRILDWAINVLLGASILLLGFALIVPGRSDVSFHKVAGTSMAPTIKRGEVIALKKVNPNAVNAGDIIGFRVQGVDTPVVHRVVRVVSDRDGALIGFITKGDNVENEDPWIVRPEDLLGVVVFQVPFVGFLEELLSTPVGFGLVVVLPGGLLLAIQVRELVTPPVVPRRRRRRSRRRRGHMWAWAYWGFGVTAAVYMGLQAQASVQERPLDSFAPSGAAVAGISRTLRNDGPVPIVVVLVSRQPDVRISAPYLWLPPGGARQVDMAGPAGARVTLVGFLPLLPPNLLVVLARLAPRWAPLGVTVLTAVPLLSVGSWLLLAEVNAFPRDRRVRRHLHGA